jgi:hypothetical protein
MNVSESDRHLVNKARQTVADRGHILRARQLLEESYSRFVVLDDQIIRVREGFQSREYAVETCQRLLDHLELIKGELLQVTPLPSREE